MGNTRATKQVNGLPSNQRRRIEDCSVLLGPVVPYLSSLIEHPFLYGPSVVGYLAIAVKFCSRGYVAALRFVRETVPEMHGAVIDARIKMADNRRRLQKTTSRG